MAQTPINHSIFWKSVMRTFRCIYVNYFNSLDFLLSSAQNCKKCTFLDDLQTITQVGNMETRQMTPIFSSIFSTLTVCNIHLFYWKIINIYLDVVSPLVYSGLKNTSILGECYQFWQCTMFFQKVDTPRLLKIHTMFCSSSGAKKRYQLMD